jgi:tetratricopeptide (TPR) repeat protein
MSAQARLRHPGRSGVLSLAVLALLLLAGCTHEQAYKRGEKLSREGQYEQAVQELETAVRLAEEHNSHKAAERYRVKLDEVKRQAGQFYYHEAETRFGWADLTAAQNLIEKCIAYCPQEPTYPAFRQRVVQAIAQAEQFRTEALSLAGQQQWQAAVQRMKESLALDKTLPGAATDLEHIRERAYNYYLARAQGKLAENDLANAETEAQAALLYQEGREAKAVVQAVKDRREAAGLIAHGQKMLEQGRTEEALQALEQAAKLYPSNTDLPDLLGRARRAVCDGWLVQGRQAVEAGNYVAAMHLFGKSHDLLGEYGGVDTLLADTRSRLAQHHLEASRQYQKDGASGCAVLHAVAALGYLPDSLEARSQLGQCSEQVRQEVNYTIAFLGFRSGPEQVDLAEAFSDATLEHLTRTRPTNVTVVERADLQMILIKQNLDVSALVGPGRAVTTDALQGVDALLTGQILEGNVAIENKRSGQGESVYQDGYRPEPNPDHVQAAKELDVALAELEHARLRLAEAEARLAKYRHTNPADPEEAARRRKAQAEVDEAQQRLANAAKNVGAARFRLANIPPEVLVPNMVKYQYPIDTFTKTAKINCMVKMLDTATGEPIMAERLEGRYAESDRVISGDPQRNVPDDPLELSDDATMLERASDPAITRLRQVLDQACVKHGQRFVVEMQRAEAAGDITRAADCSVKYLFAYPARHEQTAQMLDFVRKYLGDENTFIDLRQLLRTHCHILVDK